MAVIVQWDDGKTETWAGSVKFRRDPSPRSPFQILDDDNRVIAEVPDFGVRYIQRTGTLDVDR